MTRLNHSNMLAWLDIDDPEEIDYTLKIGLAVDASESMLDHDLTSIEMKLREIMYTYTVIDFSVLHFETEITRVPFRLELRDKGCLSSNISGSETEADYRLPVEWVNGKIDGVNAFDGLLIISDMTSDVPELNANCPIGWIKVEGEEGDYDIEDDDVVMTPNV